MSDDDHKQALPPGFRLGSYRVVRVLGVGGFGVTYLCEHAGLGVQVAVKEYLPNEIAVRDGTAVLPKSAGDREGFEWGLSRFLDEAKTLARFEHPNVVRVRDCFEANSTAYIVMDYEDGESLDLLLERLGTLTEAQLKRVVLPVAAGLREVHAAGFLHRDVKPSNIFIRRSDESPVLLDFGSARQALGQKSRSMTAIASAGYSPPEQYEREGAQGAWTDIYALSALCYRAITGEVPVEAPRRTAEVARSRPDPQKRLATAGAAGYSSGFLEVVDLGLRLVEAERPQRLEDWLVALTEEAKAAGVTGTAGTHECGDDSAELTRWQALTRGKWPKKVGISAVAVGLLFAVTAYIYPPGAWVERIKAMWPAHSSPIEPTPDQQGDTALGAVLDYYFGEVPKDAVKAAAWHRKAAEQGLAAAQYQLGRLYYFGEGVPKDAGNAAVWFRRAAEQGFAEAQQLVGAMYEWGEGVPKDAVKAAAWYRKAAEQGLAAAQYQLGRLYYLGEGVPKDAGNAAVWSRRAAEQGFAEAQYQLGRLYYLGEGVPKDAGNAAVWFRRAAEQGFAEAQQLVGVMYEEGEGVPKDAAKAAVWYRKAAEQGLAASQLQLGRLYYLGEGVPKDAAKAAAWLRKAAEQGLAEAQLALAFMYAEGRGVPKHDGEAEEWFRQAAGQGLTLAQYELGRLHLFRDSVQAYAWLNLAAAQGHEDAVRARDNLSGNMTRQQIAEAQELSRQLVD